MWPIVFNKNNSQQHHCKACQSYISLLATILTPRPKISGTITSPAFTGACTITSRKYATHSAIFPLGSTSAETTGSKGSRPPLIRTVVVSIRRGSVTSVSAYFAPRGQVLPVTLTNLPFSNVTVISQPMGHIIQFITFVSIFLFSFLKLKPVNDTANSTLSKIYFNLLPLQAYRNGITHYCCFYSRYIQCDHFTGFHHRQHLFH